jgi:hypothetical protein
MDISAWCPRFAQLVPRFRIAEGELTWDSRVIQDYPMVMESSLPVSAPKPEK